MSGQAPDAKAWADYHARQEAARRWAQSQAAPASAPAQRVLPPPVDPRHAGAQAAAAAQAQTANQQAWHHYHQQQAAAANAEAWRQYYAANPQAAVNAGVPGHGHQPHYGSGGHPGAQPTYVPHRSTPTYLPQQPPGPYGSQPAAHHGPASHHYAHGSGVTLAKNPPIAGSAAATAAIARPYAAAASASASAPASAPSPSPSQWPPALKAYVERCFESCRSNEPSRPLVTERLKRDIEDATKAGALWTTDWDARAPPFFAPGALPPPAPAPAPSGAAAAAFTATPVYGRPRGYATFLPPEDEVSGDEASLSPETRGGAAAKRKRNARDEKKKTARAKKKESRERNTSLDDELELAKRARRVGRFGDGAAEGASEAATAAAEARRARLSNLRFATSSPSLHFAPDVLLSSAGPGSGFDDLELKESAWDAFTVRGTCERLEKSYFRLTSAPDPSTVRPEPVLRAALRRLRSREVAGDPKKYNYHYLNDQLKAIRQDLVVQRLRAAFAVEAYEHHARVALRHGDLGEFNQCQTVLRDLHREAENGDAGKTAKKKAKKTKNENVVNDNSAEFLAYRVLYGAVTDATGPEYVAVLAEAAAFIAKHQRNANGNTRLVAHPHFACVAHALAARKALASSDACEWFRLLGAAQASLDAETVKRAFEKGQTKKKTREEDEDREAIGNGCFGNVYLMRVKTEEMRFRHALAAGAAFRPRVPVRFLAKTMGFSLEFPGTGTRSGDGGDEDGDGVPGDGVPEDGAPRVALPAAARGSAAESACAAWLTRHGAALVVEDGETQMDGKASAHSLFVPEDTDAVAHGDRTLDIEDFLAKAVGS
jgi:hypothetical protein